MEPAPDCCSREDRTCAEIRHRLRKPGAARTPVRDCRRANPRHGRDLCHPDEVVTGHLLTVSFVHNVSILHDVSIIHSDQDGGSSMAAGARHGS